MWSRTESGLVLGAGRAGLPLDVSISSVFSTRRARVSGFFASSIAFACSRWCEYASASQARLAVAFFLKAAARSEGTVIVRSASSFSMVTLTSSPAGYFFFSDSIPTFITHAIASPSCFFFFSSSLSISPSFIFDSGNLVS